MSQDLLNALIDDVLLDGLLFNNLFQIGDRTWQCNLRLASDSTCFHFGRGATPVEAITQARLKVDKLRPKVAPPVVDDDDDDDFLGPAPITQDDTDFLG